MTDDDYREFKDILMALKGEIDKPNNGCLTGRAVGFVRDQIEREHNYGASTFLSVKQWKWLRELYAEATGEPVPSSAGRDDLEPVDERMQRTTEGRSSRRGRAEDLDDEIPF